jgi:hypothetical protein
LRPQLHKHGTVRKILLEGRVGPAFLFSIARLRRIWSIHPMERRIVVDIDNTLWDFSSVFWERLRQISPHVMPPASWDAWDFWVDSVPEKVLYQTIKGIHLDQEQFSPYDDARTFLAALMENRFHIVIASHRDRETMGATVRWLHNFRLPYHEVHLSYDKSVLFGDCCAVVDDSPVVLNKAEAAGIVRAGLVLPWNRGTGHPLFDNLSEVLTYVKSECSNSLYKQDRIR